MRSIKMNSIITIILRTAVLLLLLGCTLPAEKKKTLTGLWPQIEPFKTGYLKVSAVHELYYELCGNPNGKPAIVLRGGPGGGC
jgi:hypothetical protein